jgi:flagellar assembly protein FliH
MMIQSTASRYERAVAELVQAHEALQRSMETQTVELALEIARKVIQREVSTDPDLVSALALVALKRVQSHHTITLRVSRYDFARIHDAVASVNGSVTIVEDSTLERGDFMMDTGSTHLDGRLQNQVDTLGRALLAEQ